MAGTGPRKGSSFERLICQQLSRWWTGTGNTDTFWRTAGSGARAKVRGRKGLKTIGQGGDITATDPIGRDLIKAFTFELKRGYGAVSPFDLMDTPLVRTTRKCKFAEWVKQAEESKAQESSLSWVIITKRDQRKVIITMPYSVAAYLKKSTNLGQRAYSLFSVQEPPIDLYSQDFDSFLEEVQPDHIRKMLRVVDYFTSEGAF